MDKSEREVLAILFKTNQTLFEAQKSNKHRINSLGVINDNRYNRLETISIISLDGALELLHIEIRNLLMFSKEYMDFLNNIPSINIYDAAEIIVEIGDITRFQNRKHFLSYIGLPPVEKHGNRYSKIKKYGNGKHVAGKKQDPIDYCENLKNVIMKCTIKLIKNDYEYQMYYDDAKKTYKSKHPMYNRKRLHLMALKKTAILFAKRIYRAFNDVAKEE